VTAESVERVGKALLELENELRALEESFEKIEAMEREGGSIERLRDEITKVRESAFKACRYLGELTAVLEAIKEEGGAVDDRVLRVLMRSQRCLATLSETCTTMLLSLSKLRVDLALREGLLKLTASEETLAKDLAVDAAERLRVLASFASVLRDALPKIRSHFECIGE